MDIRLGYVFLIEFSGYSHQSQDIVVFVDSFIRNELLVAFADPVPLSLILKCAAVEYRPAVTGDYSCWCHCVCGFDVAIAVIYGDDLGFFEICH